MLETAQSSNPTTETTVLIIGAGPAGLAVAGCLSRARVSYLIVEQSGKNGISWRHHYDRLHLHTTRQHSTLPYHSFDRGVGRYPSRQQFVDYLDSYAQAFGIEPHFNTEVQRAHLAGEGWELNTSNGTFRGQYLVVASGYNRIPKIPDFQGLERFQGEVLHSSAYKNGASYKGKRVLVVGCGNSGAEIALDLHEHGAQASLVVRNPIHVAPRDVLGNPSQNTNILLNKLPINVADAIAGVVLRLVIGDLSSYGIERPKEGPNTQIVKYGRIPLIDVGTIGCIKRGEIQVKPGVEQFTEDTVLFNNEQAEAFDAVIMATGYRSGLEDFLENAETFLGDRGNPDPSRDEGADGIFFIGYRNPPTGNIRDIKLHAKHIAGILQQRRLSA